MDIRLWWRALGDADSATEYRIKWDGVTSGSFVDLDVVEATDRGDGQYGPFVTALANELAPVDTVVTLDDGTNFGNGLRVKIGGETVRLDGVQTINQFTDCLRGADNTIRLFHVVGSPVFSMHESYLHEDVNFGSRKVIRYRVSAIVGGVDLVAAEAVAVKPTLPLTNDFTRIWGILDQIWGVPIAGQQVSVTISDGDNYNPRTMETFLQSSQSTVTDDDGYWELLAPRGEAHIGGDALQLNVAGKQHRLTTIPNTDSICYIEVL